MTRTSSRHTLFPYSTLFRSLGAAHLGCPSTSAPSGAQLQALARSTVCREDGRCRRPLPRSACPCGGAVDRREDRKSTRLNSSHPSISYAVFCLKKKKNNTTG